MSGDDYGFGDDLEIDTIFEDDFEMMAHVADNHPKNKSCVKAVRSHTKQIAEIRAWILEMKAAEKIFKWLVGAGLSLLLASIAIGIPMLVSQINRASDKIATSMDSLTTEIRQCEQARSRLEEKLGGLEKRMDRALNQ